MHHSGVDPWLPVCVLRLCDRRPQDRGRDRGDEDLLEPHIEEHRPLILLFILAFLINLVGALLCGVGLLFTYPITAVAIAYAWRTLTGGRIAELA